MVFDELEVGMDISTRGFASGIDRAEGETSSLSRTAAGLSAASNRAASGLEEMSDEATQTAAKSSLAAGRVDALGDQLAQTARRAGAAATGVSAYSAATSGAAGTSATWSAVMSASLVPALGALALTLGPLVATLGAVATGAGALAAAFGTVIGSGFLAYGRDLASTMPDVEKPTEALAKRFGELRTEIADIIAPLGRQFVPLIRDALDALPQLVHSVVQTLGPLDQFAQTLRSLGQSAMDTIPQITAAFFDLARRALPVFQDFVSFVGTRGPAAFDMLVDSFQATRDEFAQLLGATVRVLPPLLELGNTVTQILVPALAGAINAVGRAVDRFNDLPEPIKNGAVAAGLLGSAFVVAVPAVTAIAGAISALLGPLGAAVIAISTLAGAWVADIGDMRTQTTRVFNVIKEEIAATMQTLDAVTGGALSRLGDTIRGFATTARNNLGGVIEFIANQFISGIRALGETVRGTLLQLGTLWATHGDTVKAIVRDLTNFIKQNPKQALAVLATTIVPGPLATIVAAFRDNWNQVKLVVGTALNTITDIAQTAMQSFKRQILRPARNSQTEFSRNINQMLTEARDIFNLIRTVVGRIMSTLLTNIQETLLDMRQVWKANLSGSDGILANARTAFNSLWNNIIKPTLNAIQAFWRKWGDEIMAIMDGLFDAILTGLTIFTDAMLTTLNVTLDLISGDWKGAWNNINDFFQRTWNELTDWFKNSGKSAILAALDLIIAGLKNTFLGFSDWLIGNSFFPEMISAVASYLKGAGKSLLEGAVNQVTESLKGIWEQFKSNVESIVGNMIDGVESTINSIDVSGALDAINGVIDSAQDAIDKITSIPDVPDVERNDRDTGGGGGGGGGGDDDGGDDGGSGWEKDDDVDYTGGLSGADGDTTGGSGSDLYGGNDAPGLARGGYVTGPTAAWIGEGTDDEFVAPRSTMLRELRDVAREAMGNGGGTTVQVTVEEGAINAPNADADEVLDLLEADIERLYPNL